MNQFEYESFVNDHFSFKWTITDDLYLNLRLLTHKEHCDTYVLFPLFNTNIKRFLKEKNINKVPDNAIESMVGVLTFYDKCFYDLTQIPFMKEFIEKNTSSNNFDDLIDYTKKVVVKTLNTMAEKVILDQELNDECIEYSKSINMYTYRKENFKNIADILFSESLILDNGDYFQQLLQQSIETAISVCQTTNLEIYENILKIKVDRQISVDGLLHIDTILNDIGLNQKKFSKIKIYKHAFDFVANDEIYSSENTQKEIFKSFTLGLINGYLSLAIIDCMTSNDIIRIKNYENVLSEFKEDNIDTLIAIPKLIKLYSIQAHKQYLPIIALSNEFFALSEPKIIALSNYILPSVNRKTIKTKFEYFNCINFDIEL